MQHRSVVKEGEISDTGEVDSVEGPWSLEHDIRPGEEASKVAPPARAAPA